MTHLIAFINNILVKLQNNDPLLLALKNSVHISLKNNSPHPPQNILPPPTLVDDIK